MRISQQFFVRLIIQDMFNLFTGLQFYEDLQDILELTPKKDVRFIIGDRNAKVESQETPGIKIAGTNSNNLRYADDITLIAKSEEELKSLLMKVKEESKKAVLKPTFMGQRTK